MEGIRGPTTTNAQGISTSFVLVKPNDVGQAWVQEGSKIANVGKVVGYGLMGLGFGLGVYDDLVHNDKSWGQAIVHNGLSTGLSWGVGVWTAATVFGSNPIGWAALGGAAIGFGAGWLTNRVFELAHDTNFLGLQDGLDAIGGWLDDVGKNVGKAVSDVVEGAKNWAADVLDGIGEAVSNGLSMPIFFD